MAPTLKAFTVLHCGGDIKIWKSGVRHEDRELDREEVWILTAWKLQPPSCWRHTEDELFEKHFCWAYWFVSGRYWASLVLKASCYGQVVLTDRLRTGEEGRDVWGCTSTNRVSSVHTLKHTLCCRHAMTQPKTQAADVTAGRLQMFTQWVKRRTTPPWAHRANATKWVYTWSPPVRVEPQQRALIMKSCSSVMHWPKTDAHTR